MSIDLIRRITEQVFDFISIGGLEDRSPLPEVPVGSRVDEAGRRSQHVWSW